MAKRVSIWADPSHDGSRGVGADAEASIGQRRRQDSKESFRRPQRKQSGNGSSVSGGAQPTTSRELHPGETPDWARMSTDHQGTASRSAACEPASVPHGRLVRPVLGYGSISGRGGVVRSGWAPVVSSAPTVHKRGTVNGFSSKSARRLRLFLVENEGEGGGEPWGLTLTVPGPVPDEPEFRRMFSAWCHRVKRLSVPICWRIELQERGAAHVHGVGWGDGVGAWMAWQRVLLASGPVEGATGNGRAVRVASRAEWPGALDHAARLDCLAESDPTGWFRYLTAHASKSKQAQLGWNGRQWGVLNRDRWRSSVVGRWAMEQDQVWRVNRVLRKLTGLRHVSHHGKTVWLVRPSTLRRVFEWAGVAISMEGWA